MNPTRPIKTLLHTEIKVGNSVATRATGRAGMTPTASIAVTLPSDGHIKEVSSMPWEPGKSWVYGIEDGISGFGYYMYKKFIRGRSKMALQSKHKVRNASFRPVAYLGAMIEKFASKLRGM